MKKIILAITILAAGYTLCAQETVAYKEKFEGTGSPYRAPEPILTNFRVNYPEAVMVRWEPMNGWWRATYKNENNRIIHVYYNTQPYYQVDVPGRTVTSIVALPVINNFVPESVITTAINAYGSNLYSITSVKLANNGEAYQVALLENGNMRTVMINPQSVAYTDVKKVNTDDEK